MGYAVAHCKNVLMWPGKIFWQERQGTCLPKMKSSAISICVLGLRFRRVLHWIETVSEEPSSSEPNRCTLEVATSQYGAACHSEEVEDICFVGFPGDGVVQIGVIV